MPIRTMMLRPARSAVTSALLLVPALLLAQEISSSEELRLEALARAAAEIYVPRSTVTVGFRVLSSGAKVHFGNLGNVPFNTTQVPASAGVYDRTYDNGQVLVDSLRASEVDAEGVQTSTPGGRYQTYQTVTNTTTDAAGNVTGTVDTQVQVGDFVSFTPGQTRSWSYSTPEQATARPGYIAMNSYSAVSDGAATDRKQGPVGGVELQFARLVGKVTGRVQWSVVTGISLNDINNKTAGDFSATLRTNTDFYSLNGQAAPALPTADVTDTNGNVTGTTTSPYVAPNNPTLAHEDTVVISQQPVDHVETSTVGGTTVHGKYQVKGAYFMVRLGPSMHTQLTESFGVSASIGFAGAYAGTHYTAVETIDVPNLTTTLTTANPDSSDELKFLAGYFADLNFEWAANETTGLFGGVTAQSFGNYVQGLSGRTAKIDLGSTVGLRGGISVRF